MRRQLATVVALLQIFGATSADASIGEPCDNRQSATCPGSVTGDQLAGEFHGLIMVPGQPGVLAIAGRSGTKRGCGDCEWTLIVACVFNNPNDPINQRSCSNANRSQLCQPGETLFRLYLTTDAVKNRLVETLCLGGADEIIGVGDIAARDVQRYLHDVIPPRMKLTIQPPSGALAGLPAYFMVRPPAGLTPQRFGNPSAVTEDITITPAHYGWVWGDATAAVHTDDAGGKYPSGTLTHTYTKAGHVAGTVTTQWTATYTITVAGQTFGPYDASGGAVELTQPFALTVDAAHAHLVSGNGR
jgi:hypothetical protein